MARASNSSSLISEDMNALTVPYLCTMKKALFLHIETIPLMFAISMEKLVQKFRKTTLVPMMLLIPHIVVPQMLLLQPSSGLGVSETNSLGRSRSSSSSGGSS